MVTSNRLKNMYAKIKNIARRIRLIKNWYQFIYPLILWNSGEHIIKLRNGLVIHTRDSKKFTDWAVFDELVTRDVYGIDKFPNDAKRILDLGSNIGIFSLLMAKKYPEATIWAVEPEESNFEIIQKHININNLKNIIPLKKAVSNEKGLASLNIGLGNSANHSIVLKAKDGQTQTVETITLDELLPADIIKSDIEGAEYDVFTKIPNCKIIVMETHDPNKNGKLMADFSQKYDVHSDKEKIIHFLKEKDR